MKRLLILISLVLTTWTHAICFCHAQDDSMARADATVKHNDRKEMQWRGAVVPGKTTDARVTVKAASGTEFKTTGYSVCVNFSNLKWDVITDSPQKAAFESLVPSNAPPQKEYSPSFKGIFKTTGQGSTNSSTPTWFVFGNLAVDSHRYYREWREDYENRNFLFTINGKDATKNESWSLPTEYTPYFTVNSPPGNGATTRLLFVNFLNSGILVTLPNGETVKTYASYGVATLPRATDFALRQESGISQCDHCNSLSVYWVKVWLDLQKAMSSELKLPVWTQKNQARQDAQNEWTKVIEHTKTHEKEHVKNNRRFCTAGFFSYWCKQKHGVEACYGATDEGKTAARNDVSDKAESYFKEWMQELDSLWELRNSRNQDADDNDSVGEYILTLNLDILL